MTTLRVGGATDTGMVRQINQDQLLVEDDLFAVADGMGGHAAGEVASLTAVEALRASFEAVQERPRRAEDLRSAVRQANEAVFERAQSADELRGMGTTMTAAAVVVEDDEEHVAIANVGDSRAYVFVQGELTQLTEDHSVPEELVRLGQLTPDDVETHPQRHMLTRVLGVMPEVDVDLWEVIPFAGDRLLLCSDGLCRELTDDQIASVLRRLADPTEAARDLVGRAKANGGADNITALVIDITDDDGRSAAASAALAAEDAARPSAVPPAEAAAAQAPAEAAADPAPAEPEEPPTPPPPEPEAAASELRPSRRRVTARVVSFVLLVMLVFAGAGGAVWYYARQTFYVGLGPARSGASAPIIIYRGRPGGLLWFNPTIEERTKYTTADVPPFVVPDLRAGKVFTNKADARTYVANWAGQHTTTTTTPPPSTLPPLPPPPVGATTVR